MTDYEKVNILLDEKKFLSKQFKKNLEGDLENIRNISNLVQAIRWRCLEYLQDEYKNLKFSIDNYKDGNLWLDVNTTDIENAILEIKIPQKNKELYKKLYKGVRLFSERALLRQTEKYANKSKNFIDNESKYPNESIGLVKKAICELADIEEYVLSLKTENEFKKHLNLSADDEVSKNEILINLDKKALTSIPANIDHCIGREVELKNIEDKLKTNKELLLLNGIGGIGKTTLAIEYLNRYKNSYEHIAFVEYNNNIKESFLNVFKYTFKELESDSIDEKFNELFIELQNIKGKNLLVIDDIKTNDNFNIIKNLSTNFDLLITSREKLEQINFLEIEHLHKDKAKELFIQYYKTDENIDKLLEYLDYHTLFIKLTAQSLKNSNELTIKKLENKFANGEFGEVTNNLEKKTFNKYLNELFNIDRLTKNEILILKKLSLFPSIEIEYEQLKDFLSVVDDNEFDMDLNSLSNLGWLIKNNDSFKLHQVIRDFLLNNNHISYEESKGIIDTFIERLEIKPTNNPIYKFGFLSYAVSIVENLDIKNKKMTILMNWISIIYSNMKNFTKALEYQKKVLEILEQILDDRHPDLATSYNNIALMYMHMKDFKKALEYQKKDLKILEETLDNKHPKLATSLNNIALIYSSMGDFKKALEYHKKSLEILDDKDPNLALSYSNISMTYRNLGDFEKALEYQEIAIEMLEEVLDDRHPDLALIYNHISTIYQDIGDLKKALEYKEKALKIKKEILDDKHPDLAVSYNDIAIIYKNMGEFKKALEYQEKALEIKEEILYDKHPDLAGIYIDISVIYDENIGNFKKALEYQEKALEIKEEILDDKHLDLAMFYIRSSMLNRKIKYLDKAKQYIDKAVSILQYNYPNGHSDLDQLLNLRNRIYAQKS